jgi:hypothetical protein
MGGDSGGTGRRRTGGAGGGGGGVETAGSQRRLEENCNRISGWWDVVLVQNKNRLKNQSECGREGAARVKVRGGLGYGIVIPYPGIEYN